VCKHGHSLERLDPLNKECNDLQHPLAVAGSTLVGDKNHTLLNREVISVTLLDDSFGHVEGAEAGKCPSQAAHLEGFRTLHSKS